MVRYLGWLANTVLFTLCCFLVANTANAIIAALLSQSPARTVELSPRSSPQSRSWNDRQQITRRNLFHSAELSAPTSPPPPTDEELKETELPPKLWGTIAAEDPNLSWASVEETGKKAAILAVRVGDTIQSATIVAIERRRVVLLENGSRRSLSLDDDEPAGGSLASAKRSKPSTRATTTRASRRKSAKEAREAKAKAKAEAAAAKDEDLEGNPSSLYSQARIVPQIDPETNLVTGLQLNAIQAGSVFEEVGIKNGEVITEIGGIPVSDMGASTKIMSALTDPDEVEIVTVDQDGKAQLRRLRPPR
jgi:general secretion pathway protein C